MATPLPVKTSAAPMQEQDAPRTVLDVKKVDLVLIQFRDEYNTEQTQLGVVGERNVFLLESRTLGISKNTSAVGMASRWLRDGIFKLMGKKI